VLIQKYAVPAEARSVSISIDRVALPMEEPIEAPPIPVDPPWVAATMAAAPPHPPEVQAVLDEQNQGNGPKVARNFRIRCRSRGASPRSRGASPRSPGRRRSRAARARAPPRSQRRPAAALETAPTRIGAVTSDSATKSKY
jgi:hypothetical protein